MADERGSPGVSTRRKSEILSLQWPFVFLLSRGICEMDFAMSKTLGSGLLAESRGQLHTCPNVFSTLRENVAEKFFDVRKNIFQSDTMALSIQRKKKTQCTKVDKVVTPKLLRFV